MNGAALTARSALLVGVGLVAGGTGVWAATAAGWRGVALWAVTVVLAASLAAPMPVWWGGSVPLGYALAIAMAVILDPWAYALACATAVLLTLLASGSQLRVDDTARVAWRRSVALAAGGVGAFGASEAPWAVSGGVLAEALLAGAVLLVTDLLLTRVLGGEESRLQVRPSAPVYLTLLCGAALIAVAYDQQSAWMAAIATLPLLLTRFSFQRQTGAHVTLQQTVRALGIVPELAGLAPLGHSERTAVYAGELAACLRLGREARDRIVIAARLHHLGAVSTDPEGATAQVGPMEPAAMARHGAAVLREAGFPTDVADLVEEARAGTLDGEAASLEAAVVRLASAFDELVGEDPGRADQALAIIAAHPRDAHSRRAVAALLELAANRPELVTDAVAAGSQFTEAASGLDLESLVTTPSGGELLSFTRRRA